MVRQPTIGVAAGSCISRCPAVAVVEINSRSIPFQSSVRPHDTTVAAEPVLSIARSVTGPSSPAIDKQQGSNTSSPDLF